MNGVGPERCGVQEKVWYALLPYGKPVFKTTHQDVTLQYPWLWGSHHRRGRKYG